jgi:hypothetical protein
VPIGSGSIVWMPIPPRPISRVWAAAIVWPARNEIGSATGAR